MLIRISTAARLNTRQKNQLDARNAAKSIEIPQIVYLNVNTLETENCRQS